MPELSKVQKAEIAQLARQAWDCWDGREAFIESNECSVTECFKAWRHYQQGLACGKQSLTACTSEGDYQLLRAHFLKLAGREGAASSALVRHGTNPRRQALFKLRKELQQRGFAEEYAAKICRRQFRCSLAEASEKQLWCLFFTVRNRRGVQEKCGNQGSRKPERAAV